MHDIFVWKFRHFYGQSRGEVTSVMQLPNDSNQQQQSFDFYHPNFNSPTTSDVVESSIKETNKGFNQYKIVNNNNDNPESRIYFSQIAAIANAIANQLRPPITVTSTTTVTITRKIIWTILFDFITNSIFFTLIILDRNVTYNVGQNAQLLHPGLHSKSFPVCNVSSQAHFRMKFRLLYSKFPMN